MKTTENRLSETELPGRTGDNPGHRKRTVLVCLTLFVLVAATFYPACQNDFVGFDDPEYVTANAYVQRGLSWDSVRWAFRSTAAANWHPLTWLSHMLDCQLFGLAARGHHMTSVLLHALNTLLVFLVFQRMTGKTWSSVLVAVFFGIHPLRVESVAWVSERKDVLSAMFWMLTLWAYARYAEERSKQSNVDGRESRAQAASAPDPRPSALGSRLLLGFGPWTFDYCLALLFFALGLMCKPMLVTLPFALLLLDYWPLGRSKLSNFNPHPATFRSLALEKIPFLLLAVVASGITFAAQRSGGSVSTHMGLSSRLGNALISYGRYLGKTFYPVDLAAYYPHPGGWPVAILLSAGFVLLAVTLCAAVLRRNHPYLLVGWFWFLGTLVPVIGLVQVGEQAMADRYTYIPALGLLIALIWAARELGRFRGGKLIGAAAAAVFLLFCLVLTRKQIGYWRDSEAVFRHALAVTRNNYLAHDNLGTALSAKGQVEESIAQYREALRIKPDFAEAHNNLGASLEKQNRLAEAFQHFVAAIQLKPDLAEAHYSLANALTRGGYIGEAITEYERALALKPEHLDAHYNLANTLNGLRRFDEAIAHYRKILVLDPNYVEAQYNLGLALWGEDRRDEALIQIREFLKRRPDFADAHLMLGILQEQKGRWDEAASHYAQAIRLRPGDAKPHFNLGSLLLKQGRLDQAISEFRQALALEPGYTEAQAHLDAALSLAKRSGQPNSR